jgi:glycerol-3-phosphate O-acyltransferase
VLREQHLVRTDENGKLIYDATLENWAKDAKLVLSREVIHSILKITPEMAREAEPVAAED